MSEIQFFFNGCIFETEDFFGLGSLDWFLRLFKNDTKRLLFPLQVFIFEGHIVIFHFLLIVGLRFIGLEPVEFIDFLKCF